MSLLGSRRSFVSEVSDRDRRCYQCRRDIKAGETFLASRRGGVLKLGLCGEDCRLEWDAEYWEMRAADREASR